MRHGAEPRGCPLRTPLSHSGNAGRRRRRAAGTAGDGKITPMATSTTTAGAPIGGPPAPDAPLGVLMLDTAFARPVGDIGNPNGRPYPVVYERVAGAGALRVVHGRAEGLLDDFVAAGRRLAMRGAGAITTSCGFLVLHQAALAQALPVPIATSSLLQLPWIEATLGGDRRCGVVTADAGALGEAHLRCAGARTDTPVVGMPGAGAFARAVLGGDGPLDAASIGRELDAAVVALLARRPAPAAIVLECTNLAPYAARVRALARVPVYDINTLAQWLWSGHCAQRGARRVRDAS